MRLHSSGSSASRRIGFPLRSVPGLALFLLLALFLAAPSVRAQVALPTLEFLEPTNGAVFSVTEEIPIVLRGFSPFDVISSAEVKGAGELIGTAVYCCPFCPCFRPLPGATLILQIPVSWEGGHPATRTWQGWTNAPQGTLQLTAAATGESGSKLTAAPVTIRVLDLRLRIQRTQEGSYQLVVPEGSLVDGGLDLEASEDLQHWRRLGAFSPGNVAAFYLDVPAEGAKGPRFYRSVRVPPPGR